MLSIVVPCYNESGNIPLLFQRFGEVAERNPEVEIIFVNNGSTDDSARVFEQGLQQYSQQPFRVVTVTQNKGYGNGILFGLHHAKGDVLSWTHADLQTDPLDVLKAHQLFLSHDLQTQQNLLIKGKRKKRNWLDVFFTKGMEYYASASLGVHMNDINAQPKLFSRSFFERIAKDAPLDFSLDLYFLYHAKKSGSIADFPVYFTKRLHGEAKGGGSMKTKFKLVKRTLAYIASLKKKLNEPVAG